MENDTGVVGRAMVYIGSMESSGPTILRAGLHQWQQLGPCKWCQELRVGPPEFGQDLFDAIGQAHGIGAEGVVRAHQSVGEARSIPLVGPLASVVRILSGPLRV